MHFMFLLTDSRYNIKEYVLIHLNICLKGRGAEQIHSNAFNVNDAGEHRYSVFLVSLHDLVIFVYRSVLGECAFYSPTYILLRGNRSTEDLINNLNLSIFLPL